MPRNGQADLDWHSAGNLSLELQLCSSAVSRGAARISFSRSGPRYSSRPNRNGSASKCVGKVDTSCAGTGPEAGFPGQPQRPLHTVGSHLKAEEECELNSVGKRTLSPVLVMCLSLLPTAVLAADSVAVVIPLFRINWGTQKSDDPNDYYTVTAVVECPICGETHESSETLSRWDRLLGVNAPSDTEITNAGYTFAGWYEESGSPWSPPVPDTNPTPELAVPSGTVAVAPPNEESGGVTVPSEDIPQADSEKENTSGDGADPSAQTVVSAQSVQAASGPMQDITICSKRTAPTGPVTIRYPTGIESMEIPLCCRLGGPPSGDAAPARRRGICLSELVLRLPRESDNMDGGNGCKGEHRPVHPMG